MEETLHGTAEEEEWKEIEEEHRKTRGKRYLGEEEEIKNAVWKMKKKKSAGISRIPTEAQKYGGVVIRKGLIS